MDLSKAKISDDDVTKKTLKKVDGSLRKQVSSALIQFAENPLYPSLDFKQRTNSIYFSIRVSRSLRIYLSQTNENMFSIIEIGNHDFTD